MSSESMKTSDKPPGRKGGKRKLSRRPMEGERRIQRREGAAISIKKGVAAGLETPKGRLNGTEKRGEVQPSRFCPEKNV